MSVFYNPVRIFVGKEGVEQFDFSMEEAYRQVRRILVLTRGEQVERSDDLSPLMKLFQEKKHHSERGSAFQS